LPFFRGYGRPQELSLLCPTRDDLSQVHITTPKRHRPYGFWGADNCNLQPCSLRSERRFPPAALPCFHSHLCEPPWARRLIGIRSNLALNLRVREWPGIVKSPLPREWCRIEGSPRSLSGAFFEGGRRWLPRPNGLATPCISRMKDGGTSITRPAKIESSIGLFSLAP